MAILVDTVEAGPSSRPITVRLPGPLYDGIERSAEKQHRSFDEVLVEAAAAGLPSHHA